MIIWLHSTRPTPDKKKSYQIPATEKPLKLCHGRMYVVKVVVWFFGGCLFLMLMLLMSVPSTEGNFCDVSIFPYFDVLFPCCFIHPHKKYEDITSHQAKKKNNNVKLRVLRRNTNKYYDGHINRRTKAEWGNWWNT